MAENEMFTMDDEMSQAIKAVGDVVEYLERVREALAVVAGHVLLVHHQELGAELYKELSQKLKEDTDAGCVMEWFEETLEGLNYAKHRGAITALNHLFESVRGG